MHVSYSHMEIYTRARFYVNQRQKKQGVWTTTQRPGGTEVSQFQERCLNRLWISNRLFPAAGYKIKTTLQVRFLRQWQFPHLLSCVMRILFGCSIVWKLCVSTREWIDKHLRLKNFALFHRQCQSTQLDKMYKCMLF